MQLEEGEGAATVGIAIPNFSTRQARTTGFMVPTAAGLVEIQAILSFETGEQKREFLTCLRSLARLR